MHTSLKHNANNNGGRRRIIICAKMMFCRFVWNICVFVLITRLTENRVQLSSEKYDGVSKEFTINIGDLQDPEKMDEISDFFRQSFEKSGQNKIQISTTILTEREVYSTTTLRSSISQTSAETIGVVETTPAVSSTSFGLSATAPWTTSVIKTTPGHECKDDKIYYGGYCFWFDVTERNFAASELMCESRNSSVGYILDQNHYDTMMDKLRSAIPSSKSWWRFWLGLQIDPSTGDVTVTSDGQKAPYRKWRDGQPNKHSSQTNIYLKVRKTASSADNGMGDIWPTHTCGVICQHKSSKIPRS